MSAYINRTERSQINDRMLHLKLLGEARASKTQNKQGRNNENKANINEIEAKKSTI
jgi:hypothetical protein